MVEIKSIKHQDEFEQLVDLFSLTFGGKDGADYWNWQYIQNPLTKYIPEVTVAVDGNKIVGIRPFMLHELWLGDKKIIAAQHCDTLVHPDYRRQGIFNRMGKYALNYLAEHNCSLSFGFPGPMSRKGFKSQGYQPLMDIEILFKPVNPIEKMLYRINNKKPGISDDKSKVIFPGNKSYRIEVHEDFPEDLNSLDSLRNAGVIEMVRSEEYLKWRFDMHYRYKYRYILLKQDEILKGYAVISVQKQRRGLVAGIIIDYLVKDDDAEYYQLLIPAILDEFNRSSCHVIATWPMCSPVLRSLLMDKYAFRTSGNFPYSKFIKSAYMDLIVIDDSISRLPGIYDKTDWRVTYAFPNFT